MSTTGLGEIRVAKTNTMGWSPLKSVDGEVESAPAQDTFAVGVDLCSIVAHPDLKKASGVVDMLSHSVRYVSVAGGASVEL